MWTQPLEDVSQVLGTNAEKYNFLISMPNLKPMLHIEYLKSSYRILGKGFCRKGFERQFCQKGFERQFCQKGFERQFYKYL